MNQRRQSQIRASRATWERRDCSEPLFRPPPPGAELSFIPGSKHAAEASEPGAWRGGGGGVAAHWLFRITGISAGPEGDWEAPGESEVGSWEEGTIRA